MSREVLDTYSMAMGTELNIRKYAVCFHHLGERDKQSIVCLFPWILIAFQEGFKYLDFSNYAKRSW